MSSNKVIIFSAPSGAGKTTIVRYLLEKGLPLAFSISACSRSPRAGEVDAKDYYFLSPDSFKQKAAAGDFLEWEEVYENMFYGTLKSEVQRIWKEDKHVLFDVDVVGGVNLKSQLGAQALSIFVAPPSIEALKSRLEGRGTETEESLHKRLGKAEEEMAFQDRFDLVIVNDDLQKACEETLQAVQSFIA
jgi:guanylate kinase